jgi:protocatechuate 3,4-dioxygenase beta subunit
MKKENVQPDYTRRAVVHALIAAPVLGAVGGSGLWADALTLSAGVGSPLDLRVGPALEQTPACGDDDDPTPPQTEGPYYKRSSPERAWLIEPGLPGTRLSVTGQVLSTACVPIAGALLDFWQADDSGEYDLRGFRLRGHQFADTSGRFRLDTIVPGLYPGRTRHIHVRVQAPNGPILTTQLYFPGEPGNARDGIYSSALELKLSSTGASRQGAFNFVLAAGIRSAPSNRRRR